MLHWAFFQWSNFLQSSQSQIDLSWASKELLQTSKLRRYSRATVSSSYWYSCLKPTPSSLEKHTIGTYLSVRFFHRSRSLRFPRSNLHHFTRFHVRIYRSFCFKVCVQLVLIRLVSWFFLGILFGYLHSCHEQFGYSLKQLLRLLFQIRSIQQRIDSQENSRHLCYLR